MDDMIAFCAHRGEHRLDRYDRGAREREVISHLVDIAAVTAKIGLHVDDDEHRIGRTETPVEGPGIGIGGNMQLFSHKSWLPSTRDAQFARRSGDAVARGGG